MAPPIARSWKKYTRPHAQSRGLAGELVGERRQERGAGGGLAEPLLAVRADIGGQVHDVRVPGEDDLLLHQLAEPGERSEPLDDHVGIGRVDHGVHLDHGLAGARPSGDEERGRVPRRRAGEVTVAAQRLLDVRADQMNWA